MRYEQARVLSRFLSSVRITDSCWLWEGCIKKNGYGYFSNNGIGVLAHRFSYMMKNGSIEDPLQIDHLCRVRNCVNPEHLELVDQKTNILRGNGAPAKNSRKTHCPKGHQYDEANTRHDVNGYRYCKACKKEWNSNRGFRGKR